ncbi:MAG: hypothetical protein IJ660_05695 [Alphaproteobacteria bacterium]|nr:hypothetical protein [Alphaproteobacteria bacterium]
MSIKQGENMIAGSGGNIDNLSITENANEEIQTVGVIDSNNTTNAIKTWTGTKAQYDVIVTKDPYTLYNVTDDTDVSLTILEALYPIGSVYITTASTCPLSALISGSTWELVSTGIVKSGEVPVKGNGLALGLTSGTTASPVNLGASSSASSTHNALFMHENAYGESLGQTTSGTGYYGSSKYIVGVTEDSSKSGIIADTSSLTLAVNIFERTA